MNGLCVDHFFMEWLATGKLKANISVVLPLADRKERRIAKARKGENAKEMGG